MTRRPLLWLLLLPLFLVGFCLPLGSAQGAGKAAKTAKKAVKAAPKPIVQATTLDGRVLRFTVELVQSRAEREHGLMGRRSLEKMSGMLFVFPEEEVHTFWMKDTPLSLDMLFVDGQGRVVGVVERAAPFSLTPRQVDGVSKYVLEIEGGESRRLGLTRGTQIAFVNFVPKADD